ncbi:MAG: hypothetical protein GY928_34185 [Colwellia sp.]|nr:hypothetical protein [Colwellia sp.]
MEKKVKKIDSVCIGYSADLRESYFENTVIFTDGTTEINYTASTRRDNGDVLAGSTTKKRPDVAVPA